MFKCYDPMFGYNTRRQAEGGSHSLETRRKISEANKNKYVTKLTRKRISDSHKTRVYTKRTEETKLKMSSAAKGKIKSAEHRAKISATLTGRKISAEVIAKRLATIKSKTQEERYATIVKCLETKRLKGLL